MRISVLGDTSLATSVTAEKTAQGNLHLIINTRDRWVPYQVSGGWGLFANSQPDQPPVPHRIVALRANGDDAGAEVVFIADTDEEKELLSGIAYELQCKDQIVVLLMPLRSDRFKETLASWRA